jgi:hypothetical protein
MVRDDYIGKIKFHTLLKFLFINRVGCLTQLLLHGPSIPNETMIYKLKGHRHLLGNFHRGFVFVLKELSNLHVRYLHIAFFRNGRGRIEPKANLVLHPNP